jgi:hypothetical protein
MEGPSQNFPHCGKFIGLETVKWLQGEDTRRSFHRKC